MLRHVIADFGQFAVILGACILTGCTQKPSPRGNLSVGSIPIQIQPDKILELQIAKNDPSTLDLWSASFERKGQDWLISSAPNGESLVDRIAYSNFINHILDSLNQLEIQSLVHPPVSDLSSIGLSPPHFAIRGRGTNSFFELNFGILTSSGSGYVQIPNKGSQITIASGAIFKLLSAVTEFEFLRKREFSNLKSDDTVEVEIFEKNRKVYFQRDGKQWSDQKHRASHRDVGELLDKISRGEITRFLDDPREDQEVAIRLHDHPSFSVVLKDRHGLPAKMSFLQHNHELLGMISTRPHAVFGLDPSIHQDLLRFFR